MKKTTILLTAMLLCLLFAACAAEPTLPEIPPEDTAAEGTESAPLPADTTVPQITEPVETYANDVDPSATDIHYDCVHDVMYGHSNLDESFHTTSGYLIDYVGYENFDDYLDYLDANEAALSAKYSCGRGNSILDFVEYFQIPKEEFEELNEKYVKYTADYNTDAIYGGIEAAEAYYTSDRLQSVLEKTVLSQYKFRLVLFISETASEKKQTWLTEKTAALRAAWSDDSMTFRGEPNQFCLPEIITYFDIPRETAEAMYEEIREVYNICERILDFDAIYADVNGEACTAAAASRTPAALDMTYFVYPPEPVILAREDLQLLRRYEGGSYYTVSGIGTAEDFAELPEVLPIYVNPYPARQEGPTYEITDALIDEISDNLTRYLGILIPDFDGREAVYVLDPFVIPQNQVYYLYGDTEIRSAPGRFSMLSKEHVISDSASEEEILRNPFVQAGLSYLGIANPVMIVETTYSAARTEYRREYRITERTEDAAENALNCFSSYIFVSKAVDSDQMLVQIIHLPDLSEYAECTVFSCEAVLNRLGVQYPALNIQEAEVELFYNPHVCTGYYVPCWRFYLKDSAKSTDGTPLSAIVEVLMTKELPCE